MSIKDLSLRSKMVLGGMLLVLIPIIIVGAVTFINSSQTLENISKVQTVQIAESLSSVVEIAIERELKTLVAVADDPFIIQVVSQNKYDDLYERLADLFKLLGVDYESLAFIDQDGVVRVDGVDKKRIGFTIPQRDSVHLAERGKTVILPLVVSHATGEPVFGLIAPIMSKDGRFLGGVLGVLKADFLVRCISSLRLGKTGYAFMLDQNGTIIAHPDPKNIMRLSTATEEKGLKEASTNMIRQETGRAEYTYQGVKKVVGYAPLKLTGWSIAVTQHKREIMALAYTNRNLLLVVCGFFLVLTVLAVFFFSRTISSPVQKTLTTLNQAIEQATEAIIIIGLDRKVQFANPAIAKITDRPVHEMIGKSPHLKNANMIGSREIWEILEKGQVWNGRVTGVKKDSSVFSMNMTVTPVRDEAGKTNCFLAIGRDITRELMIDAQLRQSQKMEAVGTLAGGIAHDFNNILAAVMGYTEIAMVKLQQPELRHYLEQVLTASERAKGLVTQILTFSLKAEKEIKAVDISLLVREVLKLLRATIPSTIEIRSDIDSEVGEVLADPIRLHQVVMNLCTNAAYAMREKGGILEVALNNAEITQEMSPLFSDLKPGPYVKLRVNDTGVGIAPVIMDKIFDPFFTTKERGKGTGLGLSVVYGIVKECGGAVAVQSEPGRGSTFSIYLPEIERGQELAEEHSSPIQGGNERIVFIDDENTLAEMGREMLERLGYEVIAATSSARALEIFRAQPDRFDLVITDMTMPGMTGKELATELLRIRPDIPIILCTGFSEFISEEEARLMGIREFAIKPLSLRGIAKLIRRALEKRESLLC